MKKIGFLGGGNMAEALLSGILTHDIADKGSICIAEINTERANYLLEEYGVCVTNAPSTMLSKSDLVILAVKPYQIETIVNQDRASWEGKGILSIMAGWDLEKLKSLFPESCRLLRTMPNTPARVSAGMTALASEHTLTEDEFSVAQAIFESCGEVICVNESQLEAVTAISGSGPAYVFMFIDALTQGGILHGLPKATARKLAVQTCLGAAEMVKSTGISPNELKDDVCTPGGTTIEAVYSLENNRFAASVIDAVTACYNKAVSMKSK